MMTPKIFTGTICKLKELKRQIGDSKRKITYIGFDAFRQAFRQDQLQKVVNQKEIRVIGLRRSGNHAIINWIDKQSPGKTWHLNNVLPDNSPYRFLYLHFPKEHLKSEAWGNFSQKDCLIYSYEDYSLGQILNSKSERHHDLHLGKSRQRYDVLILRDPYNLFASRLKKNYLNVKKAGSSVVELWLEQAREYLGETNFLGNHKKVVISYSQWAQNQSYRQKIAAELDLDFSDAGFDDVKGEGGGSSFDGLSFKGSARQMAVNDRWKHYDHDSEYLSFFQNSEIFDYASQIFGDVISPEDFAELYDRTQGIDRANSIGQP